MEFTITVGESWTPPELTAIDETDGVLTAEVYADDNYDVNLVGTYIITYRAVDGAGNEGFLEITLNVVNASIGSINWSGFNNYYNSLGSVEEEDIIDYLANIIRTGITYYNYNVSTSNTTVVNTTKGGQYVLYDTTDVIIPMGWPSGGNFNIEGYGTYSVDREHAWPVSNMRIKPLSESRTLNSFTQFVINPNGNQPAQPNYWNGSPDSGNRGHFSDMHNLWNAVRHVNQALHSNHFYGNTGITGEPNKSIDNLFYPGDEYKGDIARIMFYMTLMYPFLTLVEQGDSNAVTGTIYYGYLDVLLEWNIEDPVSPEEIARNQIIYEHQGNRNPFIDLYDQNLANLIFAYGDPEVPYIS